MKRATLRRHSFGSGSLIVLSDTGRGTLAGMRAEVAVIPEPLKARVITKGEAAPYYAAMPLQKDSWRHLVAKEEFRLIGEPLSEQHLISIDQGTDAFLKASLRPLGLWRLLSCHRRAESSNQSNRHGGISALPGNQTWSRSLGDCDQVLGAHRIEYGKQDPNLSEAEREHLPDAYVMKNGQIMGSPLSFPVLCAINFVAYKTALRRYVKAKGGDWSKAPKLSLPVRVNGDDILFKANTEFYQNYWKPAVAAIGFSLSPGKNYISSSFLTVNSEGWRLLKNGRLEKVGYLNTGLVYSGPNGSMRPPLRQAHAEMP